MTETLLTCLLDSAVSRSIHGSVVSRLRLTDEVLGPCQGFVTRTTSMIMNLVQSTEGFRNSTFLSRQLVSAELCGRTADELALSLPCLRPLELKLIGILI